MKLIIIDDELLVLKHMSTMIEWSSYNFELIETFDSGVDAINFLESGQTIDLILTDIKMPRLSGIELANYCLSKHPDTRVAFMSAYSEFEYAQNAIKLNVIDYILKPINKEKITAFLKKAQKEFNKNNIYHNIINTSFPGDIETAKTQQVFYDLVFGVINNKEELYYRLCSVGFEPKISLLSCITFEIVLENFEEYTATVWNHTVERLYYAISSILFKIEKDYVVSVIQFNGEVINAICFPLTDSCIELNTDKLFDKISDNLFKLLKLKASYKNQTKHKSMVSLISSNDTQLKETDKIINLAHEFIKKNYKKNISLAAVSNYVALSKTYFCIYYKNQTNETFVHTLNKYRIDKAKQLILTNSIEKLSILHAQVGFYNKGHFYKTFKHYTGMTPTDYYYSIKNSKESD